MVGESARAWVLEPNAVSDEEVAAYWDEYNRVQAAIGGPVCPVCGMYLSLHGDEHVFEDLSWT